MGAAIKNIVNIYTYGDMHFEQQAIELKKLFYKYKAKRLVIDGNGLGLGLIDYMVKSQNDEFGDYYPPFMVYNDDERYYRKYKTNDAEEYKAMREPAFNASLEKHLADAKREGDNMKKDLEEKLSKLEECAAFFKQWQPKMENAFKEQITTKFKELLEDKVDENRIMTETAAMLVKYTINEEIVRLHSHIAAMKDELKNNATPGKKLDFICQEMNREINTIGSKNQFSEVGAMVIQAKDALENIREQSKNVA